MFVVVHYTLICIFYVLLENSVFCSASIETSMSLDRVNNV